MAAGPRASVSLPAHWSSRLEPGSGSQRSQRSPKLPRSPAAAAPQPTRLRARLAAAGSLRRRPRGGAEAGAGVGLPHVGGRGPGRRRCRLLRQAASQLPGAPPPPPRNGQTTRPPPPPLRSHDRPVPFGCARPSQSWWFQDFIQDDFRKRSDVFSSGDVFPYSSGQKCFKMGSFTRAD